MRWNMIHPWRKAAALAVFSLSAAALAQSPVPPAGAKLAAQSAAKPAAPVAKAAAPAENPDTIRVLLTPELETTLVAQMVGRISSLKVELGGKVQKGKAVIGFDCGEAAARLNMAQAEYNSARETLNAKERLRKLDAAGDMEVTLAAAGADKAKAAIAMSRAQLAQCTVVAPFTGRVVKVHVKPHQGVNVGAPLLEMISDGPLKLRLNIPSRWLRQVSVGTPFEVDINETGRTYQAKVTLINARVDAVAQTIELEARMDKAEPELLAGMSGIARFKVVP
ncbi:MAG TPA: efflux RND transporter periplasmic adaptor subunit [Rhodocyclaceae bacterium]|nr:efflux RND transporter periplasmic adaptor subunit [Rhodocyclaceae bacterium]